MAISSALPRATCAQPRHSLSGIFAEVTGISLQLPLTRDILNYPLAQGGLNLVQHQLETQIHFISGAMALQLQSDFSAGVGRVDPPDVAQSLDALAHFLLVSLERLLADTHPGKAVYGPPGEALRQNCVWLRPPVSSLPSEIAKPVFLQLRWATAWWTSSGSNLLPASPLILALRRHLGLPVFAPPQTCGYAPLTTGQVCSARVGEYSTHVHTCIQGPRQHRHNAIAQVWRGILREAGYLRRSKMFS